MSRSRKGSKSPGYEVHRKREGKRGWRDPGPVAKRKAHRYEREQDKREAERGTP